MGFLSELLGKTRGETAVDHTSFYVGPGESAFLSPDTLYVRVWLHSAHQCKVQRWTTKFFPAVHARFALADRSAGMTEVMSVVSLSRAFEALNPRNQWRPYAGSNPHSHHVHLSVVADAGQYDAEASWAL